MTKGMTDHQKKQQGIEREEMSDDGSTVKLNEKLFVERLENERFDDYCYGAAA